MDLDVVLARDFVGDEEGAHSLALVALELKHLLLGLLVLEHSPVAAMLLLDGLEDLLEVKRRSKARHRGDRLAPVALLDTDVDVLDVGSLAAAGGLRVGSVRERICTRTEIRVAREPTKIGSPSFAAGAGAALGSAPRVLRAGGGRSAYQKAARAR